MEIQPILDKLVHALLPVKGLHAIVLGGSRATDTASDASDVDVGLYYDPAALDLPALRHAAIALDDAHRPDCFTDPGAWGPWINGGGWLTVDGMPVDLLLRDMTRVRATVADCLAGRITIDYQCGHPFGFVNAIYLGEVMSCRVLAAADDVLPALRRSIPAFPEAYRQAAMDKFLWESGFSLQTGRKAIARRDTLYAAGALFRSAVCLIQALYALNRLYCLNEKGALHRLTTTAHRLPEQLAPRVEAALSHPDAPEEAFRILSALHGEVSALCGKAKDA